MNKIIGIFNPMASGHSEKKLQEIRTLLFRRNYQEYVTESLEHLDEVIESLSHDVPDLIISGGGDGTQSQILMRLKEHNITCNYFPLPWGTANDFAKGLGIKNLNDLGKFLALPKSQHIDVLSLNNRPVLTAGGIGLAGHVVEAINKLRGNHPSTKKTTALLGPKIYQLGLGIELLKGPLPLMKISLECDNPNAPTGPFTCLMALINNVGHIGKDFKVSPLSQTDDGLFEISLFTHPRKDLFLSCALHILTKGPPRNDPHFIQFSSRSAEFTSLNGPVPIFGDGELLEKEQRLNVSFFEKSQLPKIGKVSPVHEMALGPESYFL